MKLENQVVNLELSKKLKELGVKQESLYKYCGGHTWYYDDQENGRFEECSYDGILGDDEYCAFAELTCEFFVSAFTVAELAQYLPARIQFKKKVKKNPDWSIDFIPDEELEELKHAGFLTIVKPGRWCVNYLSNACFGTQNMAEVFWDENNWANAMAKCLIYLLENKLLADNQSVFGK